MKKTALTLLFSISCTMALVFSQDAVPSYKDMLPGLPQSPNIAALNKFIEFPVSHFNGTVDVSFPLYEIKLNGLSVPITLKYHTGGIRVNEEASWVGLGWALSAGGHINRQVYGKGDIDGYVSEFGDYVPYESPELNAYNEATTGTVVNGKHFWNKDGQREDITDIFIINGGMFRDGEPDLFVYQMGSYSGKFIMDYDGQEVDLSGNNIKFKYYYRAGLVIGDSVIASTPDGCIYKFKEREKAFSHTGSIPPYGVVEDFINPKTSSYILTEIITPNGESVKFYYKSFKEICYEKGWESLYPNYASSTDGYYFYTPTLVEEYTEFNASPGCGTNGYPPGLSWEKSKLLSYNFVKPLFLSRIEFPYGSVEFVSGTREDNYGVKLEEIVIKDVDGQMVKHYDFNYDYFVGNTPYRCDATNAEFGASLALPYPDNYIKKRLKLLSFTQNGREELSHKFYYNEGRMPYKTSFEQDFWGFYNGQPNKTLWPSGDYLGFTIPYSFKEREQGANRDVDTEKVKAGILEEVEYPTGGKTVFEYESNVCTNWGVVNTANSTYTILYTAMDIGTGYNWLDTEKEVEFTIDEEKKVDISVDLMNAKNINSSGFFAKIERYSESGGFFYLVNDNYYWDARPEYGDSHVDLLGETLQPGTYKLTASYPSHLEGSIGSDMANIYVKIYYEKQYVASNPYVGGLRIKEIKHFDTPSSPALTTTYSYEDGILATHPSFMWWYNFDYHITAPCVWGQNTILCSYGPPTYDIQRITKKIYSGTPVYQYSLSANGSFVGYRKVTETKSSGQAGRTEYEYNMESDITVMANCGMPGIPNQPHLDNGMIKSMKIFDKDDVLVTQKDYEYTLLNPYVYWAFRLAPSVFENNMGSCDGTFGWVDTYFYPVLRGKYVLDKVTETQKLNGQDLITVTDNDYAVETLSYPTRIEQSRSDGKVGRKNILYSTQYNDIWDELNSSQRSACQLLVNQNRIVPIREESFINSAFNTGTNDEFVSSVQTNYKNWDYSKGLVLPQSIYTKNKNQSGYEPEVIFDDYDADNGKLLQYHKPDDNQTSYFWGYHKQYPLAKIENMDYSSIESNTALKTMLEQLDDYTKITDGNRADLQTLNDNIRNEFSSINYIFITTYTYDPMIGVTSICDPNGKTTYYEYDDVGRLKLARDHDGKLVKTHKYHYQNQ